MNWEISDDIDIFIGEHYGYNRFINPVIHQREFKFYKKTGKLEIIDRFNGIGDHHFIWNFILCPYLKKTVYITSDSLFFSTQDTFYSQEYGRIEHTKKVISHCNIKLDVNYEFIIHLSL